MAKLKFTTINNIEELRTFAASFAATLKGGDVIGLVGELGAGKTAFVKEVAAALGVQNEVKSPTFIIMQVFETGGAGKERRIARLCHADAYRLEDYGELRGVGFLEYATDPKTVTLVEWADRVPELHQLEGFREITFSFGEGEERIIRVSA